MSAHIPEISEINVPLDTESSQPKCSDLPSAVDPDSSLTRSEDSLDQIVVHHSMDHSPSSAIGSDALASVGLLPQHRNMTPTSGQLPSPLFNASPDTRVAFEDGREEPKNTPYGWAQKLPIQTDPIYANIPGNRASIGVSIASSSRATRADQHWNAFRSIPRDQDIRDPRWIRILAQCFKFLMYIVLFGLVLGCGVVAKLCLLLLVANMRRFVWYIPCFPIDDRGHYMPQPFKYLPDGYCAWMYWCTLIAICIPECLVFLRSLRLCLFKNIPNPTVFQFAVVFFVETVHTIGLCLFVFFILPQLDSIRGAMLTGGLALIPLFLSFITRLGSDLRNRRLLAVVDAVAIFCHTLALWIWLVFRSRMDAPVLLPVSMLCISLGWWENFVTKSSSFRLISGLGKLKERLQRTRYKSYCVLSIWKCVLAFFCMFMTGSVEHGITTIFGLANPFASVGNVTDAGEASAGLVDATMAYAAVGSSPLDDYDRHARNVLWIMLCLVVSSWLCYQAGMFACKVQMERFSYAIPLSLVIPVTIVVLLLLCESKKQSQCFFMNVLPDNIFWRCDYDSIVDDLLLHKVIWTFAFWFLAYLWLVSHIFHQRPGRLSKTDTLFILPMYNGVLADLSLALNRRRQNIMKVKTKDLNDADYADDHSIVTEITDFSIAYSMTSLSLANANADSITKIYICATMWHETENEMTQMLKSIMRMDEDQSARKNAQKYLKVLDPDFYELEAHIFFDDAWEYDDDFGARVPNTYVRHFVGTVDDAASQVHKVNIRLRPPMKFDVPYGGRLVWTLPGDTRLFVHLKDRTKVRHKKRWSQVMYMYYLLGHRIMELISDPNRKQVLADNTFLLTIDGDSKFTPSSVQKLVDLMKKHRRLASSCGRIHPIGTGIMVWYQKFEYAIAHWFQKAAEHVFGCVLCSPGCFSLFRGSALMDDNVVNKYTKISKDPLHFVQYDQGEDRWLSTLLLKQGYRIEYAAAADAETYAPEGFDEFFNQRRRWTPSSIANTVDLLADYKRAVLNNDSISRGYILYQMLVILFSLLGPAIIFNMMVFAQVAAFRADTKIILWSNLTPLCIYVASCFLASSKIQLGIAKLLSVAYAFVMMAVLVGSGIQITTEGLESPIAVFVVSLAGVFFIAAFFHPKEFVNVFHGIVFFLCIPCTYVIMSMYALINLNVINWGTREAAERATGSSVGASKFREWLRKFRSRTGGVSSENGERLEVDNQTVRPESGQVVCGCERICQCFLLPSSNTGGAVDEGGLTRSDERFMWIGEHLERIDRRMERIDGRMEESQSRRYSFAGPSLTGGGILSRNTDEHRGTDSRRPQIVLTQATPPSEHRSPLRARPDDPSIPESPSQMKRFDDGRYEGLTGSVAEDGGKNSPLTSVVSVGHLGDTGIDGHGNKLGGSSGTGSTKDSSSDRDLSPLFTSLESLIIEQDDVHRGGGRADNAHEEPGDKDGARAPLSATTGPKWMQLDYLKHGSNDILEEMEHQFWVEFIEKFLTPLVRTKEEEVAAADGLKSLRNRIAFGLLLVNGLLVLIIYLLQMNKDLLSIKWYPYGNYTYQRWDAGKQKYEMVAGPLKIEPIGFTIILFLAGILIVQTIGMIMHRFHTLSHILASTTISCFRRRKPGDSDGDKILNENAIEIVRNLQKLADDGDNGGANANGREKNGGRGANTDDRRGRQHRHRRHVIVDIEERRKRGVKSKGLQHAFQKRFFTFNADKPESLKGVNLQTRDMFPGVQDSAKKATAVALKRRRDSLLKRSAGRQVKKRFKDSIFLSRSQPSLQRFEQPEPPAPVQPLSYSSYGLDVDTAALSDVDRGIYASIRGSGGKSKFHWDTKF